jgi:hypothetical protein
MARWIGLNYKQVNNDILVFIGVFGLFAIFIMNLYLLRRLIKSDFCDTPSQIEQIGTATTPPTPTPTIAPHFSKKDD